MPYQVSSGSPSFGEAPAAARSCDFRNIPTLPGIQALTPNRITCATAPNVFGVANPQAVVTAAVARALQMIDNTIGELVNARQHVCAGEPPAWPLLGDVTADWLVHRLGICIEDMRTWTAGTLVNGTVAEVIRRLTRVRNLIASNSMRYVCSDGGCSPGDWAFVLIDPTCQTTPASIIRLCRAFWVAGNGVDAATQAEFQAQTVLHEASHLFHCTADVRGASIGVAECLAQFVAATNGSPIDPNFASRCTRSSRCGTPASGLGFAAPAPSPIKLITRFSPDRAVRLKGRLAPRAAAR